MSDTPRTDSLKAQYFKDSIELDDVFDEFAQLERELAEAKASLNNSICVHHGDGERAELLKTCPLCALRLSATIQIQTEVQLKQQRDKWRECAREIVRLQRRDNAFVSADMEKALARFDELEKGEE